MNPHLAHLQPYPFERLSALLADIDTAPDGAWSPDCARFVDLSIGEPKHPAPQLVRDAIVGALDGLSSYPPTRGSLALREAIAAWIERRFGARLDPASEVPILGSREALFALAQVVVDPARRPVVVSPNPFYQIYEGAALLAGAQVHLVDQVPERNFLCDWSTVPEAVWRKTSLVYVCSPGNPTGSVMPLEDWRLLFELADRFDFTIASDECYSEIHFDEAAPPLGGLQACHLLGRDNRHRLIVFSSLSKRSNLPGMRSGFVAGDAALIAAFLRYRTYHGSAMSPVFQAASIAAWGDEAHVQDNRRRYREKFDAVIEVLSPALPIERPAAGFYLWLAIPGGDDTGFTRRLRAQYNCLVVPGSYLGRAAQSANPGAGRVQIALVDNLASCVEGARRIRQLLADDAGRPASISRPVRGASGAAPSKTPSNPQSSGDRFPMTDSREKIIEAAWEDRAAINPQSASTEVREAVDAVLAGLDSGSLRVATRAPATDAAGSSQWTVHQWIKKAVLLSFRLTDNRVMGSTDLQFFDKVETKFGSMNAASFGAGGYRVVPPAVARRGSFIGRNVVLMPSFVNIGAYVDEGTMVDTWATVGSCAQIGRNVHLSGGVGIGGVLEPLQANPTIIEDNCFIGARSEVVEGVIVEENSVLSMGVFIGQSTKIYDRESGQVLYGRVPSGSVVVPGSLPSADGKVSLYCAVIVKRVDAQTRAKTAINDLLRGPEHT